MKKDIDWSALSFSYTQTDVRYVQLFENGEWNEGYLSSDPNFLINECAGVIQYAQTCFEGLKVYETKNGDIVAFRPELNSKRMQDTCNRLMMPFPGEKVFLEALNQVAKGNIDYIPPYGSGAALYVRPNVFGFGPVIGVAPAPSYEFRMFATPVGPYFKGGVKPIKLLVSDYDRAAPKGTGDIKAGLNYAMSLYPGHVAKEQGYSENMYLDAATRTYVEETGGANFIFVTEDNTIVTPKSDTILPSITRRSIMEVAKLLGYKTEERQIAYTELKDMKEGGLCGTAAVVCPISSVTRDGVETKFKSGSEEMGPIITHIRETLVGMQLGEIEAPEGWIYKIK